MKTYADTCLERAEKTQKGPWHIGHISESDDDCADIDTPDGFFIAEVMGVNHQAFIVHARQDVPELARRLKKACEFLRYQCVKEQYCDGPYKCDLCTVANELEAPFGDVK